MRWFIRQGIKGRRVCAFVHCYKSKFCDEILKFIEEDLKIERVVYDIIEGYVKYRNDHLKFILKKYENEFDDYRNTDDEEMENYNNKNLGELPIH